MQGMEDANNIRNCVSKHGKREIDKNKYKIYYT